MDRRRNQCHSGNKGVPVRAKAECWVISDYSGLSRGCCLFEQQWSAERYRVINDKPFIFVLSPSIPASVGDSWMRLWKMCEFWERVISVYVSVVNDTLLHWDEAKKLCRRTMRNCWICLSAVDKWTLHMSRLPLAIDHSAPLRSRC